MRDAYAEIKARDPNLDIEGEMHGDCALSEEIRKAILPSSEFKGAANLFIMPNVDAANITYNMVKMMTGAIVIGPLLLGTHKPAHILTPATSPRGIVNATAICSVGAQNREKELKKA